MTNKLLVTGSRSIKDKAWVFACLDALPVKPELLIHGGAVGVDQLAGAWATEHDIPVQVVRPDFTRWPVAKYRWKAYKERDYDMVRRATRVVALWDGESSGTRLTFEFAEREGKLERVFYYHS